MKTDRAPRADRWDLSSMPSTLTDVFAPLNVVGVLKLDRLPETECLQRVLDQLRASHLPLRVRIRGHGDRYVFETGRVPAIPMRSV